MVFPGISKALAMSQPPIVQSMIVTTLSSGDRVSQSVVHKNTLGSVGSALQPENLPSADPLNFVVPFLGVSAQ